MHSRARMRSVLALVLLVAACGNDRSAASTPAPPKVTTPAPAPTAPAAVEAKAEPAKPVADAPTAAGHDFTTVGKTLFVVGACGEGTSPEVEAVPAALRKRHCATVSKAQQEYSNRWVTKARAFFTDAVPKDAPKKVVYPFAGGDLSTALTVYPDADEITTLSLEPAGDPRTVATLKGAELERALAKVEYELKWLYRVNFSNTLNMIDAMRGGQLPTQLIFGLSALKLHGFELAGVRYFRLEDNGAIHYLDDAEVAAAPDPKKAAAEQRNMLFANVEVQFKKTGGRTQVWRHIRANLGNATSKGIGPGLDADPRVLRHLESKGPISAMTKAASYLLSWDSFSRMRDYLLKNAQWMVSDATGVAPKWGKPSGFEYVTYGAFEEPHIEAGTGISADWRKEFATQPKRTLAFRFGYYDKKLRNHLVIMKRKS
jgi:hypothetical protein